MTSRYRCPAVCQSGIQLGMTLLWVPCMSAQLSSAAATTRLCWPVFTSNCCLSIPTCTVTIMICTCQRAAVTTGHCSRHRQTAAATAGAAAAGADVRQCMHSITQQEKGQVSVDGRGAFRLVLAISLDRLSTRQLTRVGFATALSSLGTHCCCIAPCHVMQASSLLA
jgi:hypothetical protein